MTSGQVFVFAAIGGLLAGWMVEAALRRRHRRRRLDRAYRCR